MTHRAITIIVESDAIARLPNGKVIVNFTHQPEPDRARKMDAAIQVIRELGWSVDDRRRHP